MGIDLTGGQTKDGRSLVGSSVFYNPIVSCQSADEADDGASDDRPTKKENVDPNAPDAVQSLAAELAASQWERADAELSERRLSSLVWIISSASGNSSASRVNVIDSNRPGDVILTFDVPAANVLCIASVSGVKDNDYSPPEGDVADGDSNASGQCDGRDENGPTSNGDGSDGASATADQNGSVGSIRYVSCSVAGVSDQLDNQLTKDNDNDGTYQRCLCFIF